MQSQRNKAKQTKNRIMHNSQAVGLCNKNNVFDRKLNFWQFCCVAQVKCGLVAGHFMYEIPYPKGKVARTKSRSEAALLPPESCRNKGQNSGENIAFRNYFQTLTAIILKSLSLLEKAFLVKFLPVQK